MSLSHEHVGPKILGKIKIYVLTRAELLFPLCYEIPCITHHSNTAAYADSYKKCVMITKMALRGRSTYHIGKNSQL